MKHICFYLDFISPYAYLAFETLPQALEGLGYCVSYKPIVFGSLLKHHGQLGPAEIGPKRQWTYRQVQWQARQLGVPLDLPASHPFSSLQLLRLAVAAGRDGCCNRYVTETIFRHVWTGGAEAADLARLADLQALLQPNQDPQSDAVKIQLRANTDEAVARGVFGVPTLVVDGAPFSEHFWGLDALPVLRDYLEGDAWFDGPAWRAAGELPVGIVRGKRDQTAK